MNLQEGKARVHRYSKTQIDSARVIVAEVWCLSKKHPKIATFLLIAQLVGMKVVISHIVEVYYGNKASLIEFIFKLLG